MDRTVRQAAASGAGELAALLRHHRVAAGLTQQQLARRVGYSRSSVANAEAGDVRAADFYRRCDAALGASGTIERARDALAAPPPTPHGPPSPHRPDGRDGPDGPDVARRPECAGASVPAGFGTSVGPVPPAEVLEHLRRHWHLLVRTDNLLGPHAALPATLEHLATLAALVPRLTGPERTAALCLSARYAETASWLHEDTGRPGEATVWAGRALERAHESGDRAALAWALHRHSRLRTAEGDHARALSLARAALRVDPDAGSPLAAALRVRYAVACAAVGDRRRCEQLLRQAAVLADVRETAGDGHTGYGGHCTRAWVLAVQGRCALVLGRPTDAVPALGTALALLAPAYHRNRGLVFGWLAEAHLRLGETEAALRASSCCREIGEVTGSASVLAQAHLVDELRRSSARRGSAA